ncbi:MAG TPA: DUF2069 domain-containing protein [Steroidobacter sp.]
MSRTTRTSTSISTSVRHGVIAITLTLVAVTAVWLLLERFSLVRLLVVIVLSTPLLAALPGLVRGNRRTHAWATLAIIPFFVLALTEAVANPAARIWAGACLALAFASFVLLIAYLRVTR